MGSKFCKKKRRQSPRFKKFEKLTCLRHTVEGFLIKFFLCPFRLFLPALFILPVVNIVPPAALDTKTQHGIADIRFVIQD